MKMSNYIDGVMNYTGSKFKLLEQILPYFDYTKSNFVDLFTGGGSVFTNVLNKYDNILANDIITDLIGIHSELLKGDHIINLTKEHSKGLKEDGEKFLKLREDYNNNPTPDKLWALILSCTSNMMRFNQSFKFNQTWGKRQWNNNTDKKVEEWTKLTRQYLDKITFSNKNFNDVSINENTFYYIDPPYGYIKDGNEIGKKQISEAGYNSFYLQSDDINLYNYCHKINNINNQTC